MYLIGGFLLAGGGVMMLLLLNVIAGCGNACNNQEFPGDQGDDAACDTFSWPPLQSTSCSASWL